MVVLGRTEASGATGRLGSYRARDGSDGAPVSMDVERPHAGLVVGKRGYGKSYTLGVLAEELARTTGVAPVVVDPLGVFETLGSTGGNAAVEATVVREPSVRPSALTPRSWCAVVGLAPDEGPGALLWQATTATETLAGMRAFVEGADADPAVRRAAANHLTLAESWSVFGTDGLVASDLSTDGATVLDLSGLAPAPANAVVRAVADVLYDHRVTTADGRLPWLLVDEAQMFFDGVAGPGLRRLLTRGRQPGVSLVVATQRPSALPAVAISQSDLLFAHRLTSRRDVDALAAARPTYMADPFEERLPTRPGEAVVVDDATESVHSVRIRERETPHGGESPRASQYRERARMSSES